MWRIIHARPESLYVFKCESCPEMKVKTRAAFWYTPLRWWLGQVPIDADITIVTGVPDTPRPIVYER